MVTINTTRGVRAYGPDYYHQDPGMQQRFRGHKEERRGADDPSYQGDSSARFQTEYARGMPFSGDDVMGLRGKVSGGYTVSGTWGLGKSGAGLDHTASRQVDVRYIDMNLDSADYSHSHLENVSFKKCSGQGISFAESFLEGCDFGGFTTLQQSSFEQAVVAKGTKFHNADLRGANLSGLQFIWGEGHEPVTSQDLVDAYQKGDAAKVKRFLKKIFKKAIYDGNTQMDTSLRYLLDQISDDYSGKRVSRSALQTLPDLQKELNEGALLQDIPLDERQWQNGGKLLDLDIQDKHIRVQLVGSGKKGSC